MQIKRRNRLGILFSLLLIAGAVPFTQPLSHALEVAQENSDQTRATKTKAPRTANPSTEVTSTDSHIACKRGCEEKYSSCVAAKEAKGWSSSSAVAICAPIASASTTGSGPAAGR